MEEPTIEGLSDLFEIGRGGFSTVYKARQPSADRDVAVKVLHTTLNEIGAARFERECQVLGSLSAHPGICTLHWFGQTTSGNPYLILELCEESLGDRLRRVGPIPWREALVYVSAVAGALQVAHDRGVLHRDIKPENILMSQYGHAVLSDFGIARTDDGWQTSTGLITASIAHAAPEILDGDAPSPASDVWSLASTTYQLLTGSAPFRRGTSESTSAVIARIFRDPPPDLEPFGVPARVREALEAAMAKTPSERISSMAAFVEALESSDQIADDSGMDDPTRVRTPVPGALPAPSPSEPLSFVPTSSSADSQSRVWPTAVGYVTAIQNPAALSVGRLEGATPTLDTLGMPMAATGQSSVVFHFDGPNGAVAVRCFTRVPAQGAVRYRALREHLQANPVESMVAAEWHDDGIRVGDHRFPVVVMPWVPGKPLNAWVEDRLDRPDDIRALAESWLGIVGQLERASIAHGDLQHGNILVDEDLSVRLVDHDGVWTPALAHLGQAEFGHPNYQHPGRPSSPWGETTDCFAAFVIYLSLRAIAADRSLWPFHMGENLILQAADFRSPGSTDAWRALAGSNDQEVGAMTEQLVTICQASHPPDTGLAELLSATGVHTPVVEREEATVVRPSRAVTTPVTPIAPTQSFSDDTSGADQWWEDDEELTVARTAEPVDLPPSTAVQSDPRPTKTSVLGFLGRNSTLSGLLAGALAGLLGGLLQGLVYPPGVHRAASSGVLAVLVTALTGGLVAAWPSLTAGAWVKAALRLSAGVAIGGVVVAVSLVGLDPAFRSLAGDPLKELADEGRPEARREFRAVIDELESLADAGETWDVHLSDGHQTEDIDEIYLDVADFYYPAVDVAPMLLVWCVVATIAGAASGVLRSRRALLSGLGGGLVGGVIGGLVFWSLDQPIAAGKVLLIDGSSPTTLLPIILTTGIIGLSIGLLDRATRLGSLVITEGRLKGRTINLDKRMMTVGSSRSCGVVLAGDPGIEAVHMTVDLNGDIPVVDADHPIRVNGEQMTGQRQVGPDDVVQLGGSFLRITATSNR